MERVAVIGSNSFSGASFCRFLLEHGCEVVGISRSAEPVDALLPYRWGDHTRFRFHRLDLNQDIERIISILEDFRPPIVVNYASQSMVAESWQAPEDWFQTNVVAMVRLHDRLRKLRFLQRYVHISTPEVYGHCQGAIRENQSYNPSTPYAVSRAACDMSLMSFYKAYSFPVVFTRAANVYGPGQQPYRIIPRAILSILMGRRIPLHGGGVSVRSFVHIDDVSAGTWKAAKLGAPGEVYHLSTPEQISIRDLVAKICSRLGADLASSVEVVGERLGKDTAYILDSQRAHDSLGWSASVDLDTGLEQTIGWVKESFEELKRQPLHYIHKK